MHSPDTELRHKQFPTERVLREIVPMLEIEYLSWGNIKMVTAGLGEKISNNDFVNILNEDVIKALGLIGEDDKFHPDRIEKLTGFKTRPQLRSYALDTELTVEKGFSLLNQLSTNMG